MKKTRTSRGEARRGEATIVVVGQIKSSGGGGGGGGGGSDVKGAPQLL